MSLATSNRDGGRTSESGHLRPLQKGISGEVLTGLVVSQRGAGANMSVDVAIGDSIIPRSDGTYGHPAWNDAVLNKAVTTADVSNPRRDIVVLYIDYAETPSTGVSNNTNGVVKCIIVDGTPAGSPADPSDAALQSAVGASNPFIKLARIRVAAAASTITNSVIDDMRTMAQALDNGGWNSLSQAWDAWAYSAYSSTYKMGTITVADSTIFTLGQKVRFWQLTGGWKYGWIMEKPNATSIRIYMGVNYSLINERIYLPAYSRDNCPDGWDANPASWSQRITTTVGQSQSNPVNGTIYNPGSKKIDVGKGLWCVEVRSLNVVNGTGVPSGFMGVGTANNLIDVEELMTRYYSANANQLILHQQTVKKEAHSQAADGSLYLNYKMDVASGTQVGFWGNTQGSQILQATPAYMYM